jgi:hypothetical protein
MTQEDVLLQLDELFGWHRFVLELTEAGGDAVNVSDRLIRAQRLVILADDLLDLLATATDAVERGVVDPHVNARVARDAHEVRDRQRVAGEDNLISFILHPSAFIL